jgi:hypothetical protein
VAEAALAKVQQRKQRAEETSRAALEVCEHACSQQRSLLRELADLKQKERVMFAVLMRILPQWPNTLISLFRETGSNT